MRFTSVAGSRSHEVSKTKSSTSMARLVVADLELIAASPMRHVGPQATPSSPKKTLSILKYFEGRGLTGKQAKTTRARCAFEGQNAIHKPVKERTENVAMAGEERQSMRCGGGGRCGRKWRRLWKSCS